MGDINGLHHVGHVVRDLSRAMETYRRLGFTVAAPAYPVLPGASDQPVGVANAHVYFPGNFVELVAVVGPGSTPSGARPIPLRVPEEQVPGLAAAIRAAVANIESFLDRFEGVHILIADTPDLDGVAARLTAAGVRHGGVHAVQRPVETSAGTGMEPARFLEISGAGMPPGRVPEGRIGFAQNTPVLSPEDPGHPNGATGLTECVLCVDDASLPGLTRRYATYFGEPTAVGPGPGGAAAVRFGRAGVTVVGASGLGGSLPGERAAALPGFAAYAVSVRDIDRTERFLRGNGVAVTRTGPRELFVPARDALGVAIVFHQDD